MTSTNAYVLNAARNYMQVNVTLHGADDICGLRLADAKPVNGQFYLRRAGGDLTIWASAEELRRMSEHLFDLSCQITNIQIDAEEMQPAALDTAITAE